MEVSEISADELEVIVESRRGDLHIGVRQHTPRALELRLHSAIDARRLDVVRQDGEVREHTAVDVVKVPGVVRTERAFEQLTDDDGTGELLLAGNGADPSRVRIERTALERF